MFEISPDDARSIKIKSDPDQNGSKLTYNFLSVFINSGLLIRIYFYLYQSFTILTNSKTLLQNFEYFKSWDAMYFSVLQLWIQRKKAEVLAPPFFEKQRCHTHTHLISRDKTAWNVNLRIYVMDICMVIVYWRILRSLLPDRDHSVVIFGS